MEDVETTFWLYALFRIIEMAIFYDDFLVVNNDSGLVRIMNIW
jgi:hypothetical protein